MRSLCYRHCCVLDWASTPCFFLMQYSGVGGADESRSIDNRVPTRIETQSPRDRTQIEIDQTPWEPIQILQHHNCQHVSEPRTHLSMVPIHGNRRYWLLVYLFHNHLTTHFFRRNVYTCGTATAPPVSVALPHHLQ